MGDSEAVARENLRCYEIQNLVEKHIGVTINRTFAKEFIAALQSLGWQKVPHGCTVVGVHYVQNQTVEIYDNFYTSPDWRGN